MNEACRCRLDIHAATSLIEPITKLVIRAGSAILAVNRTVMNVQNKGDESPVTEADLAANRILIEGLSRLAPGAVVLSEESASVAGPSHLDNFFLVDPLDGTKEFVAGRDEFTVNVALVIRGSPLLGIISAPELGTIWRGIVGQGAERMTLHDGVWSDAKAIHTRPHPSRGEPWLVAVSRSHRDTRTEAFIAARVGAIRAELGSAVKFGRVAEGKADVYPRLSPTREWDVAAGHAVVTAAGGKLTDSQGNPIEFGQGEKGFVVPEFVAWGDPSAIKDVWV
jgi:3'(2'), 5'-bisphosphate nucleotidase